MNASVEAFVAVLLGPCGKFVPSGPLVGLAGEMVGAEGEIDTSDWEEQLREGGKAEGESSAPVE